MSQPWMKFFPSDWRADPALRMCSIGARGLWIEMLCLMHEAGGSLTVNGKGLLPRQLAALAGASIEDVTAYLVELSDAGVFSRDEHGTIYSRRMRKDIARAEEDKANGSKGGNPRLKGGVNPHDNPPVGGGDKAQKPEARDQIPEADREETRAARADAPRLVHDLWPVDAFARWYAEFPNKVGRGDAERTFQRVRKSGQVSFEQLMAGVKAYRNKTDDRPWCNPATWLNQQRWADMPAVAKHGRPRAAEGFI